MENNAVIGSSTTPNEVLIRTTLDKLLDGSIVQQTTVGRADAMDATIFTQDNAGSLGIVTSSVEGGGGYFQKATTLVNTPTTIMATPTQGLLKPCSWREAKTAPTQVTIKPTTTHGRVHYGHACVTYFHGRQPAFSGNPCS